MINAMLSSHPPLTMFAGVETFSAAGAARKVTAVEAVVAAPIPFRQFSAVARTVASCVHRICAIWAAAFFSAGVARLLLTTMNSISGLP